MSKEENGKEIDIENILLKDRQLFLYGKIDGESAEEVIQNLMALDSLNKKPIHLWVHGPGGEVHAGFAIINIMKKIKSKVITVINDEVCSMNGLISVAGDERLSFRNSWWMGHRMSGGSSDYFHYLKDRVLAMEKLDNQIIKHLKKYTKLTKTDIKKAKNGELWLTGQELKKKGIVDKLI